MKKIQLGNKFLGEEYPCFIVAEISCNHLQNKSTALKLIEMAKESGADSVKFQMYTPDTMTLDISKLSKQDHSNFKIKGSVWDGYSFYELYKKAYTPWEWFDDLKIKAEELGLFFFVSPFDESAVDYLEEISIEAYKVASFEINHVPLIKKIAKTQKPIIFSTGIAELSDIELAIKTIKNEGNENIIMLKCTSAYPSPLNELNLKTISDMKKKFNVLVGLSDHTINPNVPAYSVALGACLVEKHFTLEKKGPDALFSLLPDEFSLMVKNIRECESVIGKVNYQISDKVKEHKAFSRSIFASSNIKLGEVFSSKNIKVVRPSFGLHPKYYESLLGKTAKSSIRIGEPLKKEHFE